MKKFGLKFIAIIMMALVWTSCIDNEVSQGVEAIRTAQANLINAKAAVQTAEAAYLDAQTRNLELEGDLTQVEIDRQKSELTVTVAKNATKVKEAEAELEAAKLDLQEAVDALAKYLAEQGLADAAEYLANYSDAMDDAYGYADDMIDLEADIAELNLFLTGLSDPNTYALWNERLERDLAEKQAELAAQEQALAALEAVETDPTTVIAKLVELQAEIAKLENENLALEVAAEIAYQEAEAASDAVSDAYTVMFDYEQTEGWLADEEKDLADYTASLAETQKEIADAEKLLAPFNADLTARYAAYMAKFTSGEAALQTLKEKITALDVLEAQGVTGSTLTTAQTAVTTAITAYEAIVGATGLTFATASVTPSDNVTGYLYSPVDVTPTSETDLQSTQDAYNTAAGYFSNPNTGWQLVNTIGKYDVNNYINDFEDANGVIANMEMLVYPDNNNLAYDADWYTEAIASSEEDIADYTADLAEWQADYDAAVAGIDALEDAEDAAWDAYYEIWDQWNENDQTIDLLEDVIDVLENELDNINDYVVTMKDNIEETKNDISLIETDLATNDIDVATIEANIAKSEVELAEAEASYDASIALAAKWKALLDSVLD